MTSVRAMLSVCRRGVGRLDGPTSSTLRSLARFNAGHSSESEAVDADIMDAVIRTATMDRRPLRDRRRPSPASSASVSRDSVERQQKCQCFFYVSLIFLVTVFFLLLKLWWLGGLTVKTLDLRSRGRGFNYPHNRYQMVTILYNWTSKCPRTGKTADSHRHAA